jgi:hypothetical protein
MEKKTAIYIKLKESEKIQIEIYAKRAGKTISAYLRDQALKKLTPKKTIVEDRLISRFDMSDEQAWNLGLCGKHIEVASLYLKYYGIDHRENKSEDTYKHMVNTLDDLFKNCLCSI